MGNDVEYLVFETKGIVVCKLYNCKELAKKRIEKYSLPLLCNVLDYFIPDTFVGVAKCSPDDVFDLVFGKKLALRRAKIKRAKAVNQMLDKYVKEIYSALEKLDKTGMYCIPTLNDLLPKED